MKILAIDDLAVGLIVTGLGRTYQQDVHSDYGFMGIPTGPVVATRERQDNSYKGNLYRVEAVDLPMIVIRQVCSEYGKVTHAGSWDDTPKAIDTRVYGRWAQPSREYIAALCPPLAASIPEKEGA